jgi:PAS domain S-box-containing protein
LLGSNAFGLLNVIDFLCLVAGVYLFLVLHDRKKRPGYLLLAVGTGLLALRVLHSQLLFYGGLGATAGELTSCWDALALAGAALLIACGTLALNRPAPDKSRKVSLIRVLVVIAAGMAAATSVLVWASPFWPPLQQLLRSSAGSLGVAGMQQAVVAAVAPAWFACAWIFWKRRLIGPGISRMIGAALFFWGIAAASQVLDPGIAMRLFWTSQFLRVTGSLCLGNALAMVVYEAERVAHERQRRLAVIDAVARKGITAPDLSMMVATATEETARVMEAEGAVIYLFDPATGMLERFRGSGRAQEDMPERLAIADEHPIATSARESRPVRLQAHLLTDESPQILTCDAVACPLRGVADVVGVLVAIARPEERLEPDDVETLRNAGAQLGIIIQNMALHEHVREARDRWQQTFDSITSLVTVHDVTSVIMAANEAMSDYAGLSPDELVGASLEDAFGRHAPPIADALRRCVETGQPSPRLDMNWDDLRVHQVQVTPIMDGRGAVVGCVRVARDVTEARRASGRIAQSERRYRELSEGANDVIYTHDLVGNFLFVNQRAIDVFGYSRHEFAGLRFLDIVASESRVQAKDYISALIADRDYEQIELRMVCKDSSVVVLQLRGTLMKRDGRPVGIHGIARNVTAEKQLAEQLLQYERLASVGTLIAGIAHELNNPLTVIGGYVQLLQSGLDETLSRDALDTIAEQANRCRDLAQDLLGFARRPDDNLTTMDVNRAVRGVLDLHSYDLRATNVEVVTNMADDLPAVLTEHGQLQQIVYNLIDNAHDAMAGQDGGKLTVSTAVTDGRVTLRVADSGTGIAPNAIDRIFEPFFTTKPRGKGTGLGLSICQNIAHMYGGTITAENRPEGGAVFTLALPPSDIPPEAAPDRPELEPQVEPSRPARVLIVEDEVALADLVSIYLRDHGHEIVAEYDGNAGLATALAQDFDLIICDLQLPGLNGDELLPELLQQRPELNERVVIITGDVLTPRTREFFEKTGLVHMHKPFELEQLSELVAARMAGRPLSAIASP